MPKKKPLDPQLQALIDKVVATGNPMDFINQLARQVQGGAFDDLFETREIELPGPPLHPSLVTVRVDIVDARPPIWRRLELRGDLTLADLHNHLQAVFGWMDSHLHRFDAPGSNGRNYFLTDFEVDEGETGTHERDARVDQVLRARGEKLRYTYDFGDDWTHDLKVESVRPATDDDPPARCTAGRGACPPEDAGGIHTWNELAAALRKDPDPAHLTGDFEMYAEWLPENVDPDAFSVDEANVAISLVGSDFDELWGQFDQSTADGLLLHPTPPVAEFFSRCTTPEVQDNVGGIIHRAMQIEEEVGEDDLRSVLRPWQAVLDAIGDDGVKLSAAGWMPPATVQQIWHESGVAGSYGKGNRESNTPDVARLRQECLHAGLLRTYRGNLLLSRHGKQCRASTDDLLAAFAGSLLPDKDPFTQDARVASLLFIAANWQLGQQSRWAAHAAERGIPLDPLEASLALWDDVAHLLNDVGWRINDETPIHRDDFGYDAHAPLLQLGRSERRLFDLPDSPAVRKVARIALFG